VDALPDEAAPVIKAWLDDVQYDISTRLIAHQVTADGTIVLAAQGSSQTIIQTRWPTLLSLVGQDSPSTWGGFTSRFVAREWGVVAIREWPSGLNGSGNVDSGPLIAGLSLSASAVGLAAARAQGDTELAATLESEMEWLGVGVTFGQQRYYAAGVLPVAEAFIFWAKTTPIPADPSFSSANVASLWWLWALVFITPLVLLVVYSQRTLVSRALRALHRYVSD